MRFRVVEFSGSLIGGASHGKVAIDLHVVDERGRTQRIFDRFSHPHMNTRRRAAAKYVAMLNREETRPEPKPPRIRGYRPRATQPNYSFRPACPRCSVLCPVGALYCNECGTYLYLTEVDLHELRDGV